jgi:hypothetical protein
MPTKQPAFAIDAYSALSLLRCMVTSIYGAGFFRQIVAPDRLWKDVRSHVEHVQYIRAWTARRTQGGAESSRRLPL